MEVAKRQEKEKPMKIEQRKVQGPEWGPQVEQPNSWLAQFLRAGPGKEKKKKKTYKKRSQIARGLSPTLSVSLHVFWPGMPSLLKDVFSFIF